MGIARSARLLKMTVNTAGGGEGQWAGRLPLALAGELFLPSGRWGRVVRFAFFSLSFFC